MRKIGIVVIIVILLGAIMIMTNPTDEDFDNYLEVKAGRNIEKYTQGTETIAENMVNPNKSASENYTSSRYERSNYYFFSTYKSDSVVLEGSNKYLGLFKIFIMME